MNQREEDFEEYDPDDEDEKWTCAYPSLCVMPGEHMRSECHTAADCERLLTENLGQT